MLYKDTNKPNIRFHYLGNFLRLLMKSNMDIIVLHSLTFVSKSKIKIKQGYSCTTLEHLFQKVK